MSDTFPIDYVAERFIETAKRFIEEADTIRRIAELESENAALAAHQCIYRDGSGLTSDEYGNAVCRKEEHIEDLQAKIDADDKICACSYDAPGDVCLVHSPEVARLKAMLEEARVLLVPMADIAAIYDPDEGKHNALIYDHTITVRQARAARDIVRKIEATQ